MPTLLRNPFTGEAIRPRRARAPGAERARGQARRDRARLAREIIAWDGEGVRASEPGGAQPYVLLASSSGVQVENPHGLRSEQCFQALLGSVALHAGALHVIFGLTYDANQWLRDLPRAALDQLYAQGWCYWRGYRIDFRPRRMFAVRELDSGRHVTIWDIQPWSRTGLVEACRAWGLAAWEVPELDLIARMKARRRDFTFHEITTLVDYTRAELRATVALTRAIMRGLTDAGIRPGRYDGAGAAASALLREAGVKAHRQPSPRAVEDAALCAYSGGRIELVQYGLRDGPVYQYDLRAAYPWALAQLPSLAGAAWRRYVPGEPIVDHALYRVRWAPPRAAGVGRARAYPFPWRDRSGGMFYPSAGVGWVWGPELRAALEAPAHDAEVTVERGWVLVPASDARPFAFVRELYALRRAARGEAAEVVKLAMNALYGKIIQSVAWRDGKEPPYYQIEWAGLVTSAVRAQLWRAYAQAPEAVIAFETDAIYSTRRLRLPLGPGMGQWSFARHDGMLSVQSGVHLLRDGADWTAATRGYNPRELGDNAARLLHELIMEGWAADAECVRVPQSRFISLASSADLHWPAAPAWRSWQYEARELPLWPQGKRVPGEGAPHRGLVPSWPTPVPETLRAQPQASHPYARTWRPSPTLLIEGVTPAVYEEEIEEAVL